jgi:hypothetical protein
MIKMCDDQNSPTEEFMEIANKGLTLEQYKIVSDDPKLKIKIFKNEIIQEFLR